MKQNTLVRRIVKSLYELDAVYLQLGKLTGASGYLLPLLYALDDEKAHTQKSISEEWQISKTTLNSLVKKCESEGYITLKHVPQTRRELELILTPKGKEYAKKVLAPVYHAEEKAIASFDNTQAEIFISNFEYFIHQMRQVAQELSQEDKQNDN